MAYSDEVIAAAKSLYLKRHTPKEIQKKLGLNSPRIVYYWATKFEWYTQLNTEGVEDVIARRLAVLAERDHKTPEEHDELDRLIGHHVKLMSVRNKHTERMAEIARMGVDISQPGRYGKEERGEKGAGKKERPRKTNDVSGLTAESFEPFTKKLFAYQLRLREKLIFIIYRNFLSI